MKQLGHLKSYKMKLTTLSPVFIGGGDKLSNLDFYYNNNSGILKIIDEAKFSEYLFKNKLFDNFSNYITNNGNAKLYEWSIKNKLDIEKENIYKTSYKFPKNDLKALNDINLFIKNYDKKAYIPGSSIKGALKTAILHNKLSENPTIKDKYKNEAEKALKSNSKQLINKLQSNIEIDLICFKKPLVEFKKETHDIFKMIQISDSTSFDNNDMNLYKKIDYSIGNTKTKPLPLYRECLKSYSICEFNITLDDLAFELSGIDINYILESLDNYTNFWHKIISPFEKDLDKFNLYLPNDEQNFKANFCIGGGAGFLTKTIVYSILEKDVAIQAIRQYLDLMFTKWDNRAKQKIPQHNHSLKDKLISPRALKLAKDGDDYVNLGWCNLSIAE